MADPKSGCATPSTVSHWIQDLKVGDQTGASRKLWQRYYESLVRLMCQKLTALPDRVRDTEVAADSVFLAMLRSVENGRFPDLQDRYDLWQILLDISEKKAIDQKRHWGRKKRSFRRERSISEFESGDSSGPLGPGLPPSHEPTPELAAQCNEEVENILARLEPRQRRIAQYKIIGYENAAIAENVSCSLRTVERELRRIRLTLLRGAGGESDEK